MSMKLDKPISLLLICASLTGISLCQKPAPADRQERPRIRVEARAFERGAANAPTAPQPASPARLDVSKADAAPAGFPLFVSPAWIEFESSRISFGEIVPGEGVEKPGALMVRVFSDRDWELRMESAATLQVADRGMTVPSDRLQWRAAGDSDFRPLSGPGSVRLASGSQTTPSGHLVVLDLRIFLLETDPLGLYKTDLSLYLDLDP